MKLLLSFVQLLMEKFQNHMYQSYISLLQSYTSLLQYVTKIPKFLQNISIMDPNVEPWIYPLFYPYGTQGWHRHLKKLNSDRRITKGQYVKYRMTIRDEFNVFLLERR